jgi:hypothetical protein
MMALAAACLVALNGVTVADSDWRGDAKQGVFWKQATAQAKAVIISILSFTWRSTQMAEQPSMETMMVRQMLGARSSNRMQDNCSNICLRHFACRHEHTPRQEAELQCSWTDLHMIAFKAALNLQDSLTKRLCMVKQSIAGCVCNARQLHVLAAGLLEGHWLEHCGSFWSELGLWSELWWARFESCHQLFENLQVATQVKQCCCRSSIQ